MEAFKETLIIFVDANADKWYKSNKYFEWWEFKNKNFSVQFRTVIVQ